MPPPPLNINYKVYGLIVESQGTVFLSIQFAPTLEEAFAFAKLEFEKINPLLTGTNNPLMGGKIGLFTMKTINQLVEEGRTNISEIIERKKIEDMKEKPMTIDEAKEAMKDIIEIKKKLINPSSIDSPKKISSSYSNEFLTEKTKDKRNELMNKIIKNKDKKIFEENKNIFTPYECKYIEEHLN